MREERCEVLVFPAKLVLVGGRQKGRCRYSIKCLAPGDGTDGRTGSCRVMFLF
jgi:hypothetical protein